MKSSGGAERKVEASIPNLSGPLPLGLRALAERPPLRADITVGAKERPINSSGKSVGMGKNKPLSERNLSIKKAPNHYPREGGG